MILFILGFFIGFLWIIGAVMYYNHRNPEARRFGRYSLYALIFTTVCTILLIVVSFGVPILFSILIVLFAPKPPKK